MNNSRVIISQCTDPFINLAAEDALFRSLVEGDRVLFMWRNRDAVIMGRYQNPYLECGLTELRQDDVFLVRRQSGGGTVFHDLGNTNFTFISSQEMYDKEENSRLVIGALKEAFGIEAYRAGRNDILVEGKKISGSAFKLASGRAFHHGTLLVNADLSKLARYLKPEAKKIEAKGIRSVPSRVTNLSRYDKSIDHDQVCSAVIKRVSREWKLGDEIAEWGKEDLVGMAGCREKIAELSSWEWIYGKTPPFSIVLQKNFPDGGVEICCHIKKGSFEKVELTEKSLSNAELSMFCALISGTVCSPEGILERKQQVNLSEIGEFGYLFDWLASEF